MQKHILEVRIKTLVEKSLVHKTNLIVIAIPAAYFAGMFLLTLYAYISRGVLDIRNMFVYFVFAFVLVQRAAVRSICEFNGKSIIITRIGLLQKSVVFEVALKDITGVYPYKPSLISLMSFRRTYRLNSSLDNRDVWSIAYTAVGPKGKTENRRIFFKPSEEMLDLIRDKIPTRVKSSEEEVVIQQVKDEKD